MRIPRPAALLLTTALTTHFLGPAFAQAPRSSESVAGAADRQVVLQADSVEYDSTNQTVSAIGHVEIAADGRVLLADRVTYDQKTDRVTASGNISVTDERGNVAFASAFMRSNTSDSAPAT